jgi:hypothetical protein
MSLSFLVHKRFKGVALPPAYPKSWRRRASGVTSPSEPSGFFSKGVFGAKVLS